MLGSLWRRLDFSLRVIMAVLLFAMMALTSADVLGRYVFDAPISGAFEIVQYLMAIVVFAALPATTASSSHLSVSIIPTTLRGPFGRAHRVFIRLVSALALLLIASRMALQAQILASSQQVSGYLEFPLAPIATVMAVFASLAFLIIVVQLIAVVLGHDAPAPEGEPNTPGYE